MTFPHISIIDSPTGSGKTSWAIDYINTLPETVQVCFITPYLKEVDRIINACPNRNFTQPDVKTGRGSKRNHLLSLISEGRNIVSTHALFSNIDEELIEALKSQNYILFLDEVMQVVEQFDLYSDFKVKGMSHDAVTMQDLKTLLEKGHIRVNPDFSISWVDEEYTLYKYHQLKNLADRGMLYLVNDSFLMWSFPIDVFREGIFQNVFVMTYMFDYQLQAYYYKFYNLEYEKFHVSRRKESLYYDVIPTTDDEYEREWKAKIRPLIQIVEGNINKVGAYYRNTGGAVIRTSLSKRWYDKLESLRPVVRKGMDNFFRNICDVPAEERMWTCFKEHINSLRTPKSSPKNWIEITARASNDFGHKTALAYLVNRYPIPFYVTFFEKRNVYIDEDMYALSEMIQWIFRSAVRNDKKITIYIPSERMRTLLTEWLEK